MKTKICCQKCGKEIENHTVGAQYWCKDCTAQTIVFTNPVENKTPHCCPVCGGNGQVPNGFYNQTGGKWASSSTAPETCRTCSGSGIVWR